MTMQMPKERISITIRKELLKWLDDKIKDYTYASRSHGIEHALAKLKKQKETS